MKNHRKAIIAELRTIDAKHMQLMLSRRGWETELVNTSTDLLDKLATSQYDLVMLSDNLPDANVVEVASKVRKVINKSDDLPIVAVINFTIETEKRKILNAGANYCLIKPVYNNSLSEVIGHILEKEYANVV